MQEIIDFLKALHANNEREWFNAHRTAWKRVQEQFNVFVEQLIEGIASFDPSVSGLTAKDCTYRIARDTRFSPDKTPYKNHIGAYIAPRGKKSGFAGYYFHIEPIGDSMIGHSLLSSGLYCPEPIVLRSVRDEILDNGAEIVSAVTAATGFTLNSSNSLKRTPVGFPSGSEFDAMLRLRDFYLDKPISEAFVLDDHLLEKTLAEFRRTQPFVAILNRAVQFAHEEMM
ncbi:MAG: DUF2461 domain-containing protein [Alistipes sp.]